jgi:hypothetical protein
LYLSTAHVSLACAFLVTAWNPWAVAGFFYHARIVAIVHLVTIGWIAMSILGSVYLVLPLACGQAFPARRGDYAAYGLVVVGLIGMVAHFWISEFSGMAWSAGYGRGGILRHPACGVRRPARERRGAVKLHLLRGRQSTAPTMECYSVSTRRIHFCLGFSRIPRTRAPRRGGVVCMTITGSPTGCFPWRCWAMPSTRPVCERDLLETGMTLLCVAGFAKCRHVAVCAGDRRRVRCLREARRVDARASKTSAASSDAR